MNQVTRNSISIIIHVWLIFFKQILHSVRSSIRTVGLFVFPDGGKNQFSPCSSFSLFKKYIYIQQCWTINCHHDITSMCYSAVPITRLSWLRVTHFPNNVNLLENFRTVWKRNNANAKGISCIYIVHKSLFIRSVRPTATRIHFEMPPSPTLTLSRTQLFKAS